MHWRGYKLTEEEEVIKHVMYMDDIKLLAKHGKELRTLIETINIIQDIAMESGIEKRSILKMKSGKREITEE